jgi:hypothetical protein
MRHQPKQQESCQHDILAGNDFGFVMMTSTFGSAADEAFRELSIAL